MLRPRDVFCGIQTVAKYLRDRDSRRDSSSSGASSIYASKQTECKEEVGVQRPAFHVGYL